MCSICGSSSCLTGCPNEVRKAVYTCKHCGEDILEYEEYVEIEGEYYHKSCLDDDMSGLEVAELFGCFSRTAENDDFNF